MSKHLPMVFDDELFGVATATGSAPAGTSDADETRTGYADLAASKSGVPKPPLVARSPKRVVIGV